MREKEINLLKRMNVFMHMSCNYSTPFSSFIYLLSAKLECEQALCDVPISEAYTSTPVPVDDEEFKFFPWNRELCLGLVKSDKEISSLTMSGEVGGGEFDEAVPTSADYGRYSELYFGNKDSKKHQLIFHLIEEFIKKMRDISSDSDVPFVSVVNVFHLMLSYGNADGLVCASIPNEKLKFCLNVLSSFEKEFSQYLDQLSKAQSSASRKMVVDVETLGPSDLINSFSEMTANQINSLFRILFVFRNNRVNNVQSSDHFLLWLVYKNLTDQSWKNQMLAYLHELHEQNICVLKTNENFYKSGKFNSQVLEQEKRDRMITVSHALHNLLEEVVTVLLFCELVDLKKVEFLQESEDCFPKSEAIGKFLQEDTFFITETVSVVQSSNYIDNRFGWSRMLSTLFEEWVLELVPKSFFRRLRSLEESCCFVGDYPSANRSKIYDLHQLDIRKRIFDRMKGTMFNGYELTGDPIEVLKFTKARIGYICDSLKSEAGLRSSESRQKKRILGVINSGLSEGNKITSIYQLSDEVYMMALKKLEDNRAGTVPHYITRNKLCKRLSDTDEVKEIEEESDICLLILSINQVKYKLKKLVSDGKIKAYSPIGGRDKYIYFKEVDLEQIYRFFEYKKR